MPEFDSKQYRWKDMSFSLLGVKVTDIQELTYKVEVEDEEVYGAGDEPIDIQSGNRKNSGQLTLLKSVVDELTTAAQNAGYRDILDLRFPITVSYSNTTKVSTDILMGVKLGAYNDGMMQGDKYAKIVIPFKFTRIKKNK
jgi:hypothetical protein